MCLAKGVAINVGVNTNSEWGGFRGPIFSDGSFEFIHIPWKEDKYGMIEPRPQKYKQMAYNSYVPGYLQNHFILESPNFQIGTYASTNGASANKSILDLNQGDYLLFYSTLNYRDDGKKRQDWINSMWGAYIVGLFKIDFIYESIYHVLADESAIKAFKEYDWFKILLQDPDDSAPWVKGIKEESGLLKKAIPLSSPENPQRWSDLACDLFRTSRGKRLDPEKKAIFQTVLTCESMRMEKLLSLCTLRKD